VGHRLPAAGIGDRSLPEEQGERMTWADLLDNTDKAIDYVVRQRPCGASNVVSVSHSEGTGNAYLRYRMFQKDWTRKVTSLPS
jgi:hypothetical protein